MTAQSRDTQILEKIQGYCNDIMFTHTEYAHDYHTFCTNPTYRNAIALCLMQIGELVKHPSPEFISLHTSIPWRAIRGMRNVVAHEYGNIDEESLWETITEDIPVLYKFCTHQIEMLNDQNPNTSPNLKMGM